MDEAKETSGLAEIHWEGNSRQTLAAFPDDIRADFGFALYELQRGMKPSLAARRMESVGPGVFELKQSDERTWYRIIYLARIENIIYVLHCFEKQSRKTEEHDLQIARERLRRVQQRIREKENMGNTAHKPAYVTTGASNIFADLGFSPEKALALKFKAKILLAILGEVRRKKYRQVQLVRILDEHQPVISNLLRGKVSQMSIEKLLIYADRLGLSLDIHKPRSQAGSRRAA